ncbi:MAG: B12-binding domain-containing protein, partial [Dehalococcoidia bacterium]
MTEDLLALIRENVIQGRMTRDDEGMEDGMVGQPAVTELIQRAVGDSVGVGDIIEKGLTQGMEIVGQKFEAKEYYIPDMLAAAEAVGAAMDILRPHLARSGVKAKGKIVLATVQGDLHDIGKNIVAILLQGAGYTVKDLGTDVEP